MLMETYQPRTIILVSQQQRNMAKAVIDNAPDGIEVVIHEKPIQRKKEQNGFAWAGMINDFVEQGWLCGRKFSRDAWHYHLKSEFLPETSEEGITLNGYKKWEESPNGKLILVGSTTKLTVKGFAQYITKCCAYGSSELGIKFTTRERF